jgi:two-component system CheB/CheR fusion protein
MNNLLAGTGIGTVFLDHQLRILRFTPAVTRIINLIPSDIGRPVGHIMSNLLGYNRLTIDGQDVLDSLIPKEVEVQTSDHHWFSLHIQPYRTLNNVIEGVVITFFNITETKKAREELKKANNLLRLAVVVRDAYDAITVQKLDGHIIAWNPAAKKLYGWSEEEAMMLNIQDRIPPDIQSSELNKLHLLSQSKTINPYQTCRLTKGGKMITIVVTATALISEAGTMYAIATTERELKSHS